MCSKEEQRLSKILEKEPQKLHITETIRKIAKQSIKEKGLTEEQVRKSLGIKRYEK